MVSYPSYASNTKLLSDEANKASWLCGIFCVALSSGLTMHHIPTIKKKMTKADIVNEITKNTGIDKVTVLATVEAFMDAVKASLSKDENVYLRGFGSFVVKKRAQKTARNISKNTTIIIPEHNIPAFKPAKTFTIAVKK